MNADVLYNEVDDFAADWLENLIRADLIAPGVVDRRSIACLTPDDVARYRQCHFFAGIGGWSHALRLAGWPDDQRVWTGSCPCQPFSSAARGRRLGTNDPRDLWPTWRGLIAAGKPQHLLGEQIAHGSDWIDRASDDMEALGYEVGAAILQAVAVGADHARPRIYFMGHANGHSKSSVRLNGEVARMQRHRSHAAGLVPPNGVSNRMAVFSGFGNAIHAELAAEFITASCEAVAMTAVAETDVVQGQQCNEQSAQGLSPATGGDA